MAYYFVKLLSYTVCFLPAGISRKLGDWLGELCWPLVPKKRRKMAISNAMRSLDLDEATAYRLVKQSAVRFGRIFMEVLRFPRLNKNNINRYVAMQGRHYLDEALSHGRGVILIGGHSGNWEILGQALALNGYPFVGIPQKQTNAAMDKFINEYRKLSGMRLAYKTDVREMIRLMDQGGMIGLMLDQDAKEKGVAVSFFGRPATAAPGAAVLARMRNAPIVPIFITEQPEGTHTILIHPVIWANKTQDKDEDISITTQQLTIIIENHIRQYPHEWFWLHDRWKTTPQEKCEVVKRETG
ncbi:MAG: phosphatidylinositol mannoside acyltransferase [Firmicutes bacterium]|nr:phosphatidylinositol mannoside acyltransferase [Bacillota bacterium]